MSVRAVLQAAQALSGTGEPCILATVMQVRGSAYRRPGARMLVSEREWLAGSISGGCLEGDVVKRGFFRTRDVRAVLVTYDASADDDPTHGYGLGCDGVVDVLIERIDGHTRCNPLQFIAQCRARQTRGVIASVFASQHDEVRVGDRVLVSDALAVETTLTAGTDAIAALARDVLASGKSCGLGLDGGRLQVLFEVIEPPPRLFLIGTGHDVLPVASLAGSLDWEVSVSERHKRISTQARFAELARYVPGSAHELAAEVERASRALVVIMSHRYQFDREVLGALLGGRAQYIGVLGPARRTERMLAELEVLGVPIDASALKALHAPVGLNLGAETPSEIALSVIAEAQACLASTDAAQLRERSGPIHAQPSSVAAEPLRSGATATPC